MREHPMVEEARQQYEGALRVQRMHRDDDARRVDRTREDLAGALEAVNRLGRDEVVLTTDHLTLLRAGYWDHHEDALGTVTMDPKRPYGNSDVERDLERLLPHLGEDQRYRVHRELELVARQAMALLPREVR